MPRPLQSQFNGDLLSALRAVKQYDKRLFRRIVGATSVFMESYYNTPSLDLRVRVLLQATAFEVLLDLPDSIPRKAFKDRIEELTGIPGERRFSYKYETKGRRVRESRTIRGYWADRFYTLRNHIIHGETVRDSGYIFRGKQDHLLIAPMFFVACAKRLMQAATPGKASLYDVVEWQEYQGDHGPQVGFRLQPDIFIIVDRDLSVHEAIGTLEGVRHA